MKYNRLELLLLVAEYYDKDYQPYKDDGLYILNSTTLILYGKGQVSHKKMLKFIERVVTNRDEINNSSDFLNA